MKRQLVYLVLSLLIFDFTSSQITFVPGYLITLTGDTLKGEVKINPKKDYEKFKRVMFKASDGTQKNYKPNKAKGYGIEGRNFITWKLDDEDVFLEQLTTGKIILYKSAFETVVMNETTYDYEYFLYKEGDKKLTEVKDNKFKKQLEKWMEDKPEFLEQYEDEKKLNESKAVEAIMNYNRSFQ